MCVVWYHCLLSYYFGTCSCCSICSAFLLPVPLFVCAGLFLLLCSSLCSISALCPCVDAALCMLGSSAMLLLDTVFWLFWVALFAPCCMLPLAPVLRASLCVPCVVCVAVGLLACGGGTVSVGSMIIEQPIDSTRYRYSSTATIRALLGTCM